MKKFNATWKIGDKIKVKNFEGLYTLTKIHATRCWIDLEGFECSFPRDSVTKRYDFKLLIKH